MQQHPINERLSFLLKTLNLSARAFSEAIGEKPTITQNYVGTRNSMPGADYIEKVLKHFDSINPAWLILGQGQPFLGEASTGQTTRIKNTQGQIGQVIGTNHGTANQNTYTLSDCEKERDYLRAERDSLNKQIELLNGQLQMKDTIIESKDQLLDLLRGGFNRPN